MKKLTVLFLFIYAVSFAQRSDIKSKILFNDNRIVEAEIPFRTNLFESDLIDEIAVADRKIKILENGKTIKYPASEIQKIEFTDLKNKPRTFIYFPAESSKTLVELLYDGQKIKWVRAYRRHGYDGSTLTSDVLFKGDIRQPLNLFVNNRKKLKELMADKPELEPLIENINYNRLKDEDLINLLKKYDE
ncbi:hypothetical protein H3Z85_02640 [Chryseobacterium indologenes]|uniref:Uncharacterized protein n=1 Tax=Chryseobacterium indologenes TaxID=253 RepID=A0A1Z3W3N9_CHRID|nr:hypothetical protein [Chryseobacterium indologenes]ASE62409.1 hypothetical protein CEQ15_13360 [Chryseobacterium indologenes]ATN06243.1 hypothetical protein CRN76_12950 [Chryseobacterium indologenes]AYY84995.1 hypothetical protein EGX91_10785 [Chryseobacterium indologenes]AZB18123.1 hypothetical protein EG352_10225 [Chryseobacterium indologenes]QIX81877.1 hypothetical protein FOB56_11825 [Chryseobacterium indologenes]